jgi:peptidyl-dipeptidase Dcp
LKVTYLRFVHAGANLSEADKAKLRDINKELASLSASFQQKLLTGTKAGALVLDDKAQLAGLTEAEIARAAEAANARGLPGEWMLPLQNTTQQWGRCWCIEA